MALRVAFSSSWHGEAINRDASFAENYKSGRSLSEEIAPNRHGSEPHGLLARFSHTVAVVVVADFPPHLHVVRRPTPSADWDSVVVVSPLLHHAICDS